jgi:hypothetical protein
MNYAKMLAEHADALGGIGVADSTVGGVGHLHEAYSAVKKRLAKRYQPLASDTAHYRDKTLFFYLFNYAISHI